MLGIKCTGFDNLGIGYKYSKFAMHIDFILTAFSGEIRQNTHYDEQNHLHEYAGLKIFEEERFLKKYFMNSGKFSEDKRCAAMDMLLNETRKYAALWSPLFYGCVSGLLAYKSPGKISFDSIEKVVRQISGESDLHTEKSSGPAHILRLLSDKGLLEERIEHYKNHHQYK